MRRLTPDATDDAELRAAYGVPPGRHLRVNFASSVDGSVSVDGKSKGLSSEADRELFHVLRSMADVILVGAGTVRVENYGGAKVVDGHAPPIAVVTDSLDLDPTSRLFTDAQVRPIVITSSAAPSDRRGALDAVADVIVAGDDHVDVAQALDQLAGRGLAHVLCEGGPHLFGSLLAAGLVDELCLSLAPVIAGGTAGRITAGLGTGPQALRLAHVFEDEGHLFLRYSTAAEPAAVVHNS